MELSKTKTDVEPKIDDTTPLYAKDKNGAKDDVKVSISRKRKREAVNDSLKSDERIAADNVKEGDTDSDEETKTKKAKIPCKLAFVR